MMTPVAITLVGMALLELRDDRGTSTFDTYIITERNLMSLEYFLWVVSLG